MVQEFDSRISQLRHQRAHLPQLAELAELATARQPLADAARDARIVVDDLEVVQRKAEADVEQVRARRARDSERIDAGLITNPKDLARMQTEMASLERRIGTLEDEELEVMEQLETAQAALAEVTGQIAELDARTAELETVVVQRREEIDAQLVEVEAERAPAASTLPAPLVTLYDRLREQKGGLGASELRLRQCGGCRLTLDTAELARIKALPVDEVVRCEECSRILVRTDESGL